MKRPRMVAALAIMGLAAAACGSDRGDGGGGSAGQITISGSSTVEPITSLVAEAFKTENSGIGISVDGPGTGDGFELFCSGQTDISDASRPIKAEEDAACSEAGVEYVELKVAIDGLTVLTNPANDAVECLDFPGIYALVGPESTGFTSWSDARSLAGELGSRYADRLPDAELAITAPGEESGTYDTFVELVIADPAQERGQEEATRPDYTSSPNDNVIVDGIEGTESSFGWVGFAFYEGERRRLKPIAVDGGDGECVEPTSETIASGTYPLSRPLFIYVNKEQAADNAGLARFVDFYLGEAGRDAVAEAGYVQLPDEEWAKTQEAWGSR